MRLACVFIFIFLSFLSNAQSQCYLKISGGSMSFSYPLDIGGYGIYPEYSVVPGKHNSSYWRHFQLSGEFAFEKGSREYIVMILPETDYKRAVYHISDVSVHARLSYYPIGATFLKGLYVAIGPTAGYYFYSREIKETNLPVSGGLVLSRLQTNPANNAFIGYKISVGYEFYFKRFLLGARLDWGNDQIGNIKTMYGAKIGWKL